MSQHKGKKVYEAEITAVIKKERIMFIEHIFGFYTDLKKTQFYNLKLNESNMIKEAIHKNRAHASSYMIDKWIGSDNATLQIAAYRLICSPDERQMLNQQYIESTNIHKVELSGMTEEELVKKIADLDRKLDIEKKKEQ